MKPGQLRSVEYADNPVWVYRRTNADLEYLRQGSTDSLADPSGSNSVSSIENTYRTSTSLVWARLLMVSQPNLEKTRYRSLQDEFLIIGGMSPYGCTLRHTVSEHRPASGFIFFDVCTVSWFDVAGRMRKNHYETIADKPGKRTSYNILIPPHHFANRTRLIIGVPSSVAIPEIDASSIRKRNYQGKDPTERLIQAAIYNDLEVVKAALRNGAQADYSGKKGSAFDAAIVGGSMDIIKLLVAHGARPTPDSRDAANLVQRQAVTNLLDRLTVK